jgi:hypothetical protein
MSRRRCILLPLTLFMALIVSGPVYGQDTQPDESVKAGVQPEADEALRKMGELLAGTDAFRFEAHVVQDQPFPGGQKVQFYQHRQVTVSRPGQIYVEGDGDSDQSTTWFSDGVVTTLYNARNVYTQITGPKDIDGMLDHLALNLGRVMPLADFVVSNPYQSAISRVQLGTYLGLHRVRDTLSHHLAFRQEGIDWQIWIDAGEVPVPRKLLITFTGLAGQPQWSAELENWDLDPDIDDDLFVFEAPADAKKLDPENFDELVEPGGDR